LEETLNTDRHERATKNSPASFVVLEHLESRTLCYASIPAAESPLDTVQIRPAATTYSSDLTLVAGTTYFLRASGYTRTSANAYDGDAVAEATTSTSTTSSSWGITTSVGSLSLAPTAWGASEGDHVYGQYITPTTTGALSFVFANDGTDKISTLAVTIYGVVPAVRVATIQADSVSGTIPYASLGSQGVLLPLNDADWDHNGVADDQQSGRVVGDEFLLPVVLPAISTATPTSHIEITPPHGIRVWLNPDRTGSTVGIGLRANKARTVYLEGYAEQTKGAAVNLQISLPIAGAAVVEDIPVTVFSMNGPLTATEGQKQVFSSDYLDGKWLSAVNGALDTVSVAVVNKVAFANVVWSDTAGIGYADFEADADYLWGWPVQVGT
jgi:hypothetical protein